MKRPPVLYADSPEGKIAYQVVGDGPIDLMLLTPGGINLDLAWDHPLMDRFLRRLASFSRLIRVNARGTGLADPWPSSRFPLMEEWSADLFWVLDAVGAERVAVLAEGDLGPFGIWCAATFPDRVSVLALLDSYATLVRRDDYPWGMPLQALHRLNEAAVSAWGTGEALRLLAPELADDELAIEWYGRLERNTASPALISHMRSLFENIDNRGILTSIQAPTLVISHTGNQYIRAEHGRYLAEHIPNARYVERSGFYGLHWVHDTDWVLDEVQAFSTGTRGTSISDERVLSTLLFTDIVGSTERTAALGDERWRHLLDEHDQVVQGVIERYRGKPIKWTGDGVLATFDGPWRAIKCAISVIEAVRQLGIDVRTGLHTGEIELRGEDIGGIAVSIGARVMAEAGPGEVLVSGAVPPLVAGSGLDFEDRGSRQLKGVPGEWRLFSVKA